jgi:septum formation protein
MSQPLPSPPLICLASASPRRRELLAQIGVPFRVAGAPVDESRLEGEPPRDYVMRLARAKALAGRAVDASLPVLAADTTVVIEGALLGKPANQQEAQRMLSRLSGRVHEVLTAVALADSQGVALQLSASQVRFREITEAECTAYWHTGEPCDKAGGYAIQGLGAVFVEWLQGSYSGVMGLPLFETARLLQAAGIGYWHRAGGTGT